MPNISFLVFTNYYLPAYKGGGPIRTLVNMVEQLGNTYSFRIVTSDRDFEDDSPYDNIRVNQWNRVGRAEVFYCSPDYRSFGKIRQLIQSTPHDIIYLNSFFESTFTIKPLMLRRLGTIPPKPIVIAPRGEFSPGALEIKALKKHLYLSIARFIGLYDGLTWQASSVHELRDIYTWFGDGAHVIVAPNISSQIIKERSESNRSEKTAGYLRVLFLSRVSPIKNLDYALSVLKETTGRLEFNIYGPQDDREYWKQCEQLISELPANIKATYRGAVRHDRVSEIMAAHDLLFLPTKGENYGHVIFEALSNGCPVLISDQTPWRHLEPEGVGWDLSLESPDMFREVIEYCTDMDAAPYRELSERVSRFIRQRMSDTSVVAQNRELFKEALARSE